MIKQIFQGTNIRLILFSWYVS